MHDAFDSRRCLHRTCTRSNVLRYLIVTRRDATNCIKNYDSSSHSIPELYTVRRLVRGPVSGLRSSEIVQHVVVSSSTCRLRCGPLKLNIILLHIEYVSKKKTYHTSMYVNADAGNSSKERPSKNKEAVCSC